VGIITIELEAGARWILPAASAGVSRHIYFFSGKSLKLGGSVIAEHTGADVDGSAPLELVAQGPAEVLILQGRPIGEPIARNGPFVMNTQSEIRQAYADYRATRFGGWPWETPAPVHGRDPARFARLINGKSERPG
jgi:redox-sensitive bicupin YhaK (pirin superfamily)